MDTPTVDLGSYRHKLISVRLCLKTLSECAPKGSLSHTLVMLSEGSYFPLTECIKLLPSYGPLICFEVLGHLSAMSIYHWNLWISLLLTQHQQNHRIIQAHANHVWLVCVWSWLSWFIPWVLSKREGGLPHALVFLTLGISHNWAKSQENSIGLTSWDIAIVLFCWLLTCFCGPGLLLFSLLDTVLLIEASVLFAALSSSLDFFEQSIAQTSAVGHESAYC